MINLTVVIDNDEAVRRFKELQKVAKTTTSSVVTDSERMDIAMRSFGRTLASLGAGVSFVGLARQVAVIRGEFQQLEVAFTTLLKNKAKADSLMAEMVELAAKTPFDLQGVANGARQLLAYGFTAEDITDTLTRLGNVAAGLGLPLERLTYLYGTTAVQGRLYARDMLQFTSSGIPMLQEMAKMYGVTTEEINAMVTAGKIGFDDVKKVIEGMTNEGGQFYNLMQEQSKTITGLISNLGDALDTMFNDIGKSQEGVIAETIQGAITLTENYEKVAKVLVVLVATYGSYKTALMLVTAASKGWTIASLAQYKVLLLVEKAQKLLNTTMLSNPYILAAAALAAIVTSLILFRDKTTEAEKAQQRFNEELEKEKQLLEERKAKTDSLSNAVRDETLSATERMMAYQELQSMYPGLLRNMTMEEFLTKKQTEATKAFNEENAKSRKQQLQQDYEKALVSINQIKANLAKIKKDATVIVHVSGEEGRQLFRPSTGQLKVIDILNKALIQAQTNANGFANELNKIAKAEKEIEFSNQPKEVQIASLKENITLLKQQIADINKIIDNAPKAMIPGLASIRGGLTASLESSQNKLSSIDTQTKTYGESFRAAKKEWEEAKKALQEIEKAKDKYSTEAYNNAKKRVDETKKAYSDLGGVVSAKELNSQSEAAEKIARMQVEAQFEAENLRIEAMSDGRDKRLKEIDNEYAQTIAKIDENEKKLQAEFAKAGQAYTPETAAYFTSQRTSAQTIKDRKTKQANEQYEQETAAMFAELGYLYEQDTLKFMSEQQRKEYAQKQSLDKMRKESKKKLESGDISEDEYTAYNTAIDQYELNSLVEKYRTTESKIQDIIEESNAEIAKLRQAGRNAEADEAEKQMKQRISQVSVDALQNSEDWITLFNNIDSLSAKSIYKAVDKLKEVADESLRAGKLTAEEYANLMNTLGDAEDKATSKNPFAGVVSGFKSYRSAMNKAIALWKKYDETQDEADKNAAENADIDVRNALAKAWKAVGEAVVYVQEALNGVTSIADALGADEDTLYILDNITDAVGGLAQAVTGFAEGGPMGILNGIAGIGSFATGIINLFNNDRKHEREIKRQQRVIDELSDAYDRLGEAIDNAYSSDAVRLYEQQTQNLEAQNRAIERQIEAENRKKKTDDDKIYDWQKQIEENNRQIIENQKLAVEAIMGTDIKSAIDDFAQAYADAWTNGTDAAQSSAEVISNLLQGAFLEKIKQGLQPQIESLFNYIASASADGLTAAEEAEIARRKAAIDKLAEGYEEKYGDYFKDAESDVNTLRGEISEKITEKTAGKLEGLARGSYDVLKESLSILKSGRDILSAMRDMQANGWQSVHNIRDNIIQIQANTAKTAYNTGETVEAVRTLDKRLQKIEQNTSTKYYGK